MTHSTVDGTVVRRKGNRGSRPNARKEWIVIRMDTYVGALNMWKPTLPMTIKQAAHAFNHFSRWDEVAVKMITVKEWEAMQAEMAWKHNAPYNPQFLGAQPAQAGQDY